MQINKKNYSVLRHAWIAIVAVAPCMAVDALPQSAPSRHCNGYIGFSGRFINVLFEREVDDVRHIQESLAGSVLSGLAHTQGRVVTELVPDNEHAVFDVQLRANASVDDGTAERRRLTILSSTVTEIDARKRVRVDESGMQLQPAQAKCTAAITLNDVVGARPIVKDIILRAANRMIGQLEEQASRTAELRAAEQLDEQCDLLIGEANRAFTERIRDPLVRNGVWPAATFSRSSERHLQFALLIANESQPAGPALTTKLSSNYDIAVCLHETIFDNFCETLLPKGPVTDQHWLQWMKILTGDAPRSLWVHDREARWQVMFAKNRPVSIQFRDELLTISLRFDEIVRGETRFQRPMNVSVKYHLGITSDGPTLNREGDVVVGYVDPNSLDPTAVEMQAFIESKFFNGVFPPDIYFDGLSPPAGGAWAKLRQFELREFSADRGWLIIAYQVNRERQGEH